MKVKHLKLLIVLFHGLIFVAAGHGAGIILILDIVGIYQIPAFFIDSSDFKLLSDFGNNITLTIFFSLIGKLLILISLLFSFNLYKNVYTIMGLTSLFVSLRYLLVEYGFQSVTSTIILLSSTPFLISTIYLISRIIKTKKAL